MMFLGWTIVFCYDTVILWNLIINNNNNNKLHLMWTDILSMTAVFMNEKKGMFWVGILGLAPKDALDRVSGELLHGQHLAQTAADCE